MIPKSKIPIERVRWRALACSEAPDSYRASPACRATLGCPRFMTLALAQATRPWRSPPRRFHVPEPRGHLAHRYWVICPDDDAAGWTSC
jgi:hypothetical protein